MTRCHTAGVCSSYNTASYLVRPPSQMNHSCNSPLCAAKHVCLINTKASGTMKHLRESITAMFGGSAEPMLPKMWCFLDGECVCLHMYRVNASSVLASGEATPLVSEASKFHVITN